MTGMYFNAFMMHLLARISSTRRYGMSRRGYAKCAFSLLFSCFPPRKRRWRSSTSRQWQGEWKIGALGCVVNFCYSWNSDCFRCCNEHQQPTTSEEYTNFTSIVIFSFASFLAFIYFPPLQMKSYFFNNVNIISIPRRMFDTQITRVFRRILRNWILNNVQYFILYFFFRIKYLYISASFLTFIIIFYCLLFLS